MTWPVERTALLGTLVDAGYSAARAAPKLDVSRCAAIAKAHRMGWRFGARRDAEPLTTRRRSRVVEWRFP